MPNKNYDNMKVEFYTDKEGEKLSIKHCEILFGSFRNFSGKPTRINPQGGDRYFNVVIPPERIQAFLDKGINVKSWQSSKESEYDDEPIHFIKVGINYGFWQTPQISSREGEDGRWIALGRDALGLLDNADFDDVSLVLKISRGVNNMTNKPYTSLYLRHGLFTKHVDEPNPFERDMFEEYGYNPYLPATDELDEEAPFT